MMMVPDPRCSRAKKHVLAEILTCLVAGYVTGHYTFRRCVEWCQRHIKFLRKGMRLETGDRESSDYQIVGMVSDMILTAKEMGKTKREHWHIENSLHHVLDDTLREDRSPAKKSKNNLALIRKFAYNILRLVSIQQKISRPNTSIMDLLSDDLSLLGAYIFTGIEALN